MIVCKICERDIQEDKLGGHSLKCKEVAKSKEEISDIKNLMTTYIEKARRLKKSLETQAWKQKYLFHIFLGLISSEIYNRGSLL